VVSVKMAVIVTIAILGIPSPADAKDIGFLPGAEGFTGQLVRPGSPATKAFSKLQAKKGKVGTAPIRPKKLNLNSGTCSKAPSPSPTGKMAFQLSEEYKDYQKKFNSPPPSKRFDTNQCSEERFKKLARDPNAKGYKFDRITVEEARAVVQAEIEGLVVNAARLDKPYAKSVDLDYKIDGPYPYTHVDIKHPVGSEILRKQNRTIDLETMARNMAKKIDRQKRTFCGLEEGPESPENVLHIVDLAYVPSHEKEFVKKTILNTSSSVDGIKFLNDE
jgi:hypothetical protein